MSVRFRRFKPKEKPQKVVQKHRKKYVFHRNGKRCSEKDLIFARIQTSLDLESKRDPGAYVV
jgi:hypothetical protein